MATKIQIRRDTAANWLTSNPVLSQGEPGMEVDTGRIKYGDGSSTWTNLAYSGDLARIPTDGVNGNPWRIVNVEGYKEFDYQTPGHLLIHIPITSGLANSSTNSVTVDLVGQDITGLLQSYNQGLSVRVFLNNDRSYAGDTYYLSSGGSITQVTGTTYTLTWTGGNLTLNEGEELTVQYYVRGTQDTKYNLQENYDYYPNQTAANTNQVVINFDNNSSGMSDTTMNDLQNFASNSAIRFYTSMGNQLDEFRNITSVSRTGNTFTISFDGVPMNITTPTLSTFSAKASAAQNGSNTSNLYISTDLYPQLKDCIRTYDTGNGVFTGGYNRSGYITFDGSTTIDFSFYGNIDEYDASWEIALQGYYTITPTTTIEVNFYNAPTIIALYVSSPDQANYYYGKKWFDWTTDLPQKYFGTPGNGVQGGTMNVTCSFYDTLAKQWWYETYPGVTFATVGGNTFFDYPGGYFDSSFPFDNRDEEGLFFFSSYTSWGDSRTIKVRIMYQMELMVNENFYYWYC
jgi:Major tropism determinant N-terminal domain